MSKSILSLFLAIIHASSGIILLIFSSWFIAACAIAGVQFNYLLPAVVIRALALIRIASGYGQMWLGHQQLLENIAQIRMSLFNKLHHALINEKSLGTEALAHQSEAIANIWIGWVNQNAGVFCMLLLGMLSIVFYLPGWSGLFLAIFATYIILILWLCWSGMRLSHQLFQQLNEFRLESEGFLNSAAIWHLDPKLKHPDAEKIWRLKQDIQLAGEHSAWFTQLVSYLLLLVTLFSYYYSSPGNEILGNPLLMIGIMLLLSARDWIAPGLASQPALSDYFMAKKQFESLPIDTLTPLEIANQEAIQQLTLNQFKADIPAVKDISLDIKKPGLTLLKGSSGVGKSTLLKACCGLLPHTGEKWRNNILLAQGRIQPWLYVEQNPKALNATLRNNLLIANPGATDEALHQALKQSGLGHLQNLSEWLGIKGRSLSGGELKRLALARALLADFEVLLLDEPLEGLDQELQNDVTLLINELSKQHIIIMASHIFPTTLQVQHIVDLD